MLAEIVLKFAIGLMITSMQIHVMYIVPVYAFVKLCVCSYVCRLVKTVPIVFFPCYVLYC